MMIMRLAATAILLAASLVPFGASAHFNDLPQLVRDELFYLSRVCTAVGGQSGDPMAAIEFFDFDEDGTPDIILDAGRFPCAGVRQEAHCPEVGCSTSVYLSHGGNWRPAFDTVGSYCIDRTSKPPRLVTIQRNFLVDGTVTILNVRFRFSKGMALQEGRGSC
jgi:hypothetical protein